MVCAGKKLVSSFCEHFSRGIMLDGKFLFLFFCWIVGNTRAIRRRVASSNAHLSEQKNQELNGKLFGRERDRERERKRIYFLTRLVRYTLDS